MSRKRARRCELFFVKKRDHIFNIINENHTRREKQSATNHKIAEYDGSIMSKYITR